MTSPEICCVIPTYNEKDYIKRTLENLSKQTVADKMEVIISDFDPDNTQTTKKAIEGYNVRYLKVLGKGIGYARDMGIKSSTAPYIVNMDADAIFPRDDAIEMLVRPMKQDGYVLTHGAFLLDEAPSNVMMYVSNIVTILESVLPVGRTAGLAVTRYAYNTVNGFRYIIAAEDYALCVDIMMAFGLPRMRYIPEVSVVASSRRFKSFNKDGLGVLDYSNTYRGVTTPHP